MSQSMEIATSAEAYRVAKLRGGDNIHIFALTDHENNRFQKDLIIQNTNIWILSPPPIIELATPMHFR